MAELLPNHSVSLGGMAMAQSQRYITEQPLSHARACSLSIITHFLVQTVCLPGIMYLQLWLRGTKTDRPIRNKRKTLFWKRKCEIYIMFGNNIVLWYVMSRIYRIRIAM